MDIKKIPLSKITLPPELDREALDVDELRQLSESIASIGLLNPITVELCGDHYMLRAGRRRMEAHRILGWHDIEANVRSPGELGHGETITWAENLERAQLSFLEEARSIKRMMEKTGFSIKRIAKLLHRSDLWVDARLELLRAPPELQQLVHRKELALSSALELARVADDDHRAHLTAYAVSGGASNTVIKDWVAQWRLHRDTGAQGAAPLPQTPMLGGRYVIMVPCLTCGTAHPSEQLRIVRICEGCIGSIVEATAEWRHHAGAAGPPEAPLEVARSITREEN